MAYESYDNRLRFSYSITTMQKYVFSDINDYAILQYAIIKFDFLIVIHDL